MTAETGAHAAGTAPPGGPNERRGQRLDALVLALLALAATFTNSTGSIAADARYEHLTNPIQFLQRHGSIWDDSRGLGEPSRYFSPVLSSYQALLQWLGASPWIIERLTHSLLLSLAGIGAMALFRGWFGTESRAAVLAGIVYAFGPYASQYLVPSGLFVAYAVAPWLALFALHGTRPGADRWRWAAAFALVIFSVGMLNTPALMLGAMPAGALVLATLAAGESNRRSTWRWL